MFNSKNKNALAMRGDAAVPTVVSADLNIVGNMLSDGVIEVAGRVEGNVKCDELNLRPTGYIKGDIIAKTIKINGEIHGVIKGKQVTIAEKGKVHGFIVYETLAVIEGATIFGQLKQTDRDESLTDDTTSFTTPITQKETGSTVRKMKLVNKGEQ